MDFSDWSTKDYALFGTALAATYADVQSTKDSIRHHNGAETNPIYGTPHPTGAALDTGGLIAAGLATAAAHGIPEKYRGAFLGGWTGLETGLTIDNAKPRTGDAAKAPFSRGLEAALPTAALGALAGYLLPSGSGNSTVGPGMVQGIPTVSYVKKFAEGGKVNGRLSKAPTAFIQKLKKHGVREPLELEVALNSVGFSLYDKAHA